MWRPRCSTNWRPYDGALLDEAAPVRAARQSQRSTMQGRPTSPAATVPVLFPRIPL